MPEHLQDEKAEAHSYMAGWTWNGLIASKALLCGPQVLCAPLHGMWLRGECWALGSKPIELPGPSELSDTP